jgi:hypothetical protein
MVKFNKGDKVYEIGSLDGKGMFYIREVEIKSWGAKQGTAISMENGKYTESRIYVTHANNQPHGAHYFKIGTVDPVAKALELAASFIAHNLADAQSRLGMDAYHQGAIQERIAFFSTAKPSVRDPAV